MSLVWFAIGFLFLGVIVAYLAAVGSSREAQSVLIVCSSALSEAKDEIADLRRRVQELERQLSGEGCRSDFTEPGPVPRLRLPGRPS